MLWRLEGYDTFDNEPYELEGGPYRTEKLARIAASNRLQELEKHQPTKSSGGQGKHGIQDQVFLVHPDGRKERITEIIPAQDRTEFVKFKLITMPCCDTQICWVNPRIPNFCPECGEKVFTRLKVDPSRILVQDDNARLIVKH